MYFNENHFKHSFYLYKIIPYTQFVKQYSNYHEWDDGCEAANKFRQNDPYTDAKKCPAKKLEAISILVRDVGFLQYFRNPHGLVKHAQYADQYGL